MHFVIVFLFLTTSKKASVQRRRRDTSGWRPRASERDPRARIPSSHPPPRSPPHANPLLALLVSLGAAPVRVAHTPTHDHLRERSVTSFPDPGPRPTRPEPDHRERCHGTPSCTHTLTICRLTHTRPIKRRLIPSPPRSGEPGTKSLSLPHPIPSPIP